MAHDASGTSNGSAFTRRVGIFVGALTSQREGGAPGVDMLSKGVELVLTTVIVGGLGALLDAWLGTAPFLMFGLGGFALAYQVWKMVVGYEADMRAHEDRLLPPGVRKKRDEAAR
jgi:hypothetical protein